MLRAAGAVMTALLLAATAEARSLRVHIDRVEADAIIAHGVEVELDDAGDAARLSIAIERASLRARSGDVAALRATCSVRRTDTGWQCKGAGSAQRGAASTTADFDAALVDGRLSVSMMHAPARLAIAQGADASWTFTLDDVPLAWFGGVLQSQWPDAKPPTGRLAADLAWRPDARGARVRGDYRVDGLGFDADGGRVAAAALTFGGTVDVDLRGAAPTIEHAGAIERGELLFRDFYARFDARAALDVAASVDGSRWNVRRLRYDDPGVLRVSGSAVVDAAAPALASLQLDDVALTLPAAYERYAKSLLAPRSFGDLQTRGTLRGALRWDAQGLAAFDIGAGDLDIVDAQRRFALRGAGGGVGWRRDGETAPTTLAWHALDLYALPFGAAQTHWRSRGGVLGLAGPATIPLFDGALELSQLDVRPDAARDERVNTGFAVHGVDMARLSRALGWPAFGGTLGGAVPQIRYVGERIELDGGLMLAVFDGTINITGLALERPFGVAPTLAANIAFADLDLALLTGTFDFGEISGRLSGAVDALRLVDWTPVSFDAQMHALGGGKISQRAVNSLSAVGGGGFVAGLQARVLRIFDTFGYARLGLGCRLQNNVCRMRGLDSSPQGYTLVDGRGLPRIRIVGHQTEVDWPVLVERLKAATSGTKPIVE